ncbi:MAG: hypothetical protein J6X33_01125 [Clostridiales bacterium]|nr:hypothetical protein [Clostridiales bacterium]
MSDSKFIKILIAICIIGFLLTAAHAAYIYFAYQNSSIIYFVSKEIW